MHISTEATPAVAATAAPTAAADGVLVLDFGGQYSQLIARRVRECGVFAELLPHHVPLEEVTRRRPRGLILSGGPASVYADEAPKLRTELLELGVPVLGICYGMQAMVLELGGRVEGAEVGEFGRSRLTVEQHGRLLRDTPAEQSCWMSHRDTVYEAPPGFTALAASTESPVAAIENAERGLYGIQFHPEVVHTPYGTQILETFLRDICGCDMVVVGRVGDRGAGGAHPRAGRRRQGDLRAVRRRRLVGGGAADLPRGGRPAHLRVRGPRADAQERGQPGGGRVPRPVQGAADRGRRRGALPGRLAGVTDPERKRKIIGEEFIRVFEEQAARLGNPRYLVQGTLYSDVIESGGGTGAATIKSHHNVGGLPEDLEFELVEPLRMLFKDEVRQVGAELGMPDQLVWRQPFPGPGLAIRVVGGEVTKERLEILRDADAILQDEIRSAGLYRELWQSFCVLPGDLRSVGVQGDERTYGYVVVIRAVTSDDAMTADWARLPYDLLERVASRMINEIAQVNRVTLDITSKPPGTIEWE